MRDDLVSGVAAASIWLLGCGCGLAVVKSAGNDAGDAPVQTRSPDQGQQADPDGGAPVPASLSGQVTLLGAASNAGAQVTISEPGMNPAQAVTDSNGSYFMDALPAGDFTATFSAAGYQTQTRQGTLAAGDATQISVTLERSLLLSAFAALPDGGEFLGYSQWVSLPDGGRESGEQLFYLDPSTLAALVPEGDAGAAVQKLISADGGGLNFLGFDSEGGAVVEELEASGAAAVDFVDDGVLETILLGAGVSRVVPMGDGVFFATPTGDRREAWFSFGRSDLGPTPLEQAIGVGAPAVVLKSQMAGWNVGDAGLDIPVVFAPECSLPLDQVCTSGMTPLAPSVDGERFGFVVSPAPAVITFDTGVPVPGACTQPDSFQVFIAGDRVVEVVDQTFENAVPRAYPISNTAYVGEIANADGSQHLFVHEVTGGAAGSTWKSDWEGDVEGWAPLQGSNLLAAARVDGGVALVVVGEGQPGSAARGIASSGAIPFAHEWSTTVFATPDNRYVVFAGIASLFDLENQTETPLIVTPVTAAFDRLETIALLTDANGQMVTVSMGDDSSAARQGTAQGTALEGVALLASFTASEDGVVYLGTDPTGATGLFIQPIP